MLIDDGDAIWSHVGHGTGHQVLDGAYLFGGGFSRAHPDADGRGGLLGIFLEQLALGQHQVHAGRGNAVQRADGARQFTFQRPLAVQLLDKIGLAQCTGVVEDLISDRPRRRQTLSGQHQPGRSHLVARHQDRRPVALDLILDAGLIEGCRNRARLLEIQARIEQRLGLTQIQEDGGHDGGKASTDPDDRSHPTDPEPSQQAHQRVQIRTPLPHYRGGARICGPAPLLGRIYPVLG